MLGTVVNAGAIILGGSIGLVLKKGLPKRFGNQVMNGLALCVLYIGISGTLQAKNVLMLILSMVIGTLIGELLDLDERVTQLGNWLENKFKSKDEYVSISEGFVSASLLFCVGAMAIVGALQDGLKGDSNVRWNISVNFFNELRSGSYLIKCFGFDLSRWNHLSCEFDGSFFN